jgi:exo-beta-1,3-glucanase (GH17 family)
MICIGEPGERHSEIVLSVISGETMDFKVMLGADLAAEMSNPHCSWGADFSEEVLSENRQYNLEQFDKLVALANDYPDKLVVITEAGWTTASNGRVIDPHNASEELQAQYYAQLLEWTTSENIFTFVFEAFDEPWKGSPHPLEPEKHWGLFKVDRTPKLVMQELY